MLILCCACLVALIALEKTKNRHQQRINRYLSHKDESLTKHYSAELFNQQRNNKGWRASIERAYQQYFSLIDSQSLKKMAVIMVLLLTFIWLLSESLTIWLRICLELAALLTIPLLLIIRLKKQRLNAFEADFPTALAMLARALSAGISTPQAINQLSETMEGSVGESFTRISGLLAIGVSLEDALDDAVLRVPVASFKFFSVTLVLNQHAGGQLSHVISQLMTDLHQKTALNKKLLAMTAQSRASAKIIAALVPLSLLLFYVNSPQIFDYLREDETGKMVSIYAISSVIFGLFIINIMTNLDD